MMPRDPSTHRILAIALKRLAVPNRDSEKAVPLTAVEEVDTVVVNVADDDELLQTVVAVGKMNGCAVTRANTFLDDDAVANTVAKL